MGSIARLSEIGGLNIGHSIVARALLVGMEKAVRDMAEAIRSVAGMSAFDRRRESPYAERTPMIEAFGRTDVGRRRKVNEDSFLVAPELNLYAVCDGMGGHNAGEVASADGHREPSQPSSSAAASRARSPGPGVSTPTSPSTRIA